MRLPSYRHLQWLFPIAVTLHNGEEAISMPTWEIQHAAQMPVHPPDAAVLRLILIALTLGAFAVTYLSWKKGERSIWAYLTFGYVMTMLANVFVPHIPAALVFRAYAPGVLTAVLINLPLMSLLAVLAVRERWVQGWKAAGFAVLVPAVVGGTILTLFALGDRFH